MLQRAEQSSLIACNPGLRRLDTGALVKDYEGTEREVEMAVQMAVMNVVSEDPRYTEKEAIPLSEEYPEGSNVIFLGEHAYGVAARVSGTSATTLSVIIAVSFPRLHFFTACHC